MPDKEGSDDGKKSTKSVVNKKQKQMLNQEDYLPEEGYDIARDEGRVRPSKDKKDATTMPVSDEVKKTQKKSKGKSALELVKAKYGKAVMDTKKEELDLTKVAETFGGYIVEVTNEQQKEQEKKLFDKERSKVYTKFRKKTADKINTTPSRLEKDIDTGLKALDRPAGGKLPKQGFATGQPFQADDNPQTQSGKYPATGKSTLKGRQRYPSSDKSSIYKRTDVKRRLDTRIGYATKGTKDEFPNKSDISKFVDKATAKQGPLDTSKGKDSSLYKTVKKYVDAKSPTIPSKTIDRKTGKPQRLPMPEGPKRDAKVARNLKQFDADIVKAAKLPKGLKVPRGGTRKSAPFSKKELNLQFKADKLKLDYGMDFVKRDPKYRKMTAAQKKQNIADIKTDINKKNPVIVSPDSGGKLPATKVNLRKSGVKGFKEPKVPETATKQELQKILNQKRFARIKRGASIKARKGLRFIRKNPLTTAIGLGLGKDTFLPPKIGLPPMPKGGKVGKRTAG